MNGARFVHDQLELLAGGQIADAVKIRGLRPGLPNDRPSTAWVLADFHAASWSAIWSRPVRARRARADRFRLHSSATAPASSSACPICFATANRAPSPTYSALLRGCLRARAARAWAASVEASLYLIDSSRRDQRLRVRAAPVGAEHRYVPLLTTGIPAAAALSIAERKITVACSEFGRSARFALVEILTSLSVRTEYDGYERSSRRDPGSMRSPAVGARRFNAAYPSRFELFSFRYPRLTTGLICRTRGSYRSTIS